MYYVEIVRDEDGEVVRRLGPLPLRRAERVQDGVGINLDWQHYSTRLVRVEIT